MSSIGQELIRQDSKGKDVTLEDGNVKTGRRVEAWRTGLFTPVGLPGLRRHVHGIPAQLEGSRFTITLEQIYRKRQAGQRGLNKECDAEIEDPGNPAGRDDYVSRAEVAVHDAGIVDRLETSRNVQQYLQPLLGRREPDDSSPELYALYKLRDDAKLAFTGPPHASKRKDPCKIGMLNLAPHRELAQKRSLGTSERARVDHVAGKMQDLQSDRAEGPTFTAVHSAVCSCAQRILSFDCSDDQLFRAILRQELANVYGSLASGHDALGTCRLRYATPAAQRLAVITSFLRLGTTVTFAVALMACRTAPARCERRFSPLSDDSEPGNWLGENTNTIRFQLNGPGGSGTSSEFFQGYDGTVIIDPRSPDARLIIIRIAPGA